MRENIISRKDMKPVDCEHSIDLDIVGSRYQT